VGPGSDNLQLCNDITYVWYFHTLQI
jgi:hypothetical protein